MRRTARLPLPLLLISLMLAGCTPSEPMPTPPPTPSEAPVFASDEEALAAAEAAYSIYTAAIDAVLADGGLDADRLRPLASPEVFDLQNEGFSSFLDKGWRTIGTTALRNFTLQRYEGNEVALYVCVDISRVDVVDSSGVSHVSADRPSENAREAVIEWIDEDPVVTEDNPWAGEGVC